MKTGFFQQRAEGTKWKFTKAEAVWVIAGGGIKGMRVRQIQATEHLVCAP